MIVRLLKWLRDANVSLSWKTTPTQLWESRAYALYDLAARSHLGRPLTRSVVDVGGGRTWHFGDEWWLNPGFKLIGVDVDAGELALNERLDEAVVADVCESLGVADGSVDLVLGRAVVEHLHDTEAFLRSVQRALRPGGCAVLVFANKWAPPMVLNRLLPERISERLLHSLVPGSHGICAFKAYYDKCTHSAFRRAALGKGLEIEYEYTSYYSSSYFQFFWPLHLASIALDLVRQMLSIRDLATMSLFVLRKPDTLQPVPSGNGSSAGPSVLGKP